MNNGIKAIAGTVNHINFRVGHAEWTRNWIVL